MISNSFELIDQPSEHTFFKFLPSLKVQKQRNNFVYDQDLVIICTANPVIADKYASLYTTYDDIQSN